MRKHILIYILTLLIMFTNIVNAADKFVTADYKVAAKDGFNICATLKYAKDRTKKEYKTVVLLHSLGYDSNWWEDLPELLLNKGYAVLSIDLRGHGKSVYNSKLNRVSWSNMSNNAFSKYPDDVIAVLNTIKSENKRTFLNNWVLVGSDIGSGTAILVANKYDQKPKTIVMLSPIVKSRSIYVPVDLAELDGVDILSISGKNDVLGIKAQEYLKKFAQSTFTTYSSESKSSGMLMFKSDKSLTKIITAWIYEYLK